MDKDDAKQILREFARLGGMFIRTKPHCLERMDERNVNMDDLLNALSWGTVEKIEETETGYKCTVKGKDIDEDDLTCIVLIPYSRNQIICRTVF